MPQKKKAVKRRSAANGKKSQRFGRNWSVRNMLVFAVIFAAIGGYLIWRSFAASGFVLTAKNFDVKNSVGAAVVTENNRNIKHNTQVVQVAIPAGALGSQAVLIDQNQTLDQGTYRVCLFALALGSPVQGILQVKFVDNGAMTQGVFGQTDFTATQQPDYAQQACTQIISYGKQTAVAGLVINKTANPLRIGFISFTRTGDAPPPPPPTVGVTPPSTLPADCSVDVSYLNAFGAWLNGLPNNSVVNLPQNACYLIKNEIDIVEKNGLTIHGNGATFKRTAKSTVGNGRMIQVLRSNNITIEGLILRGPKSVCTGYESDSRHGLAFDWSSNINVYNNQIWDTYADNIYFSGGGQHINVHNNELHQAGRHGIGIVGGSDITIDHNIIANSHRQNIDLEPNGQTPVNGITITNNQLLAPNYNFINGGPGPNLKSFRQSGNTENRNSPYPDCRQ